MVTPLKMQVQSGRMSDLTAETPPYPIGVVSR